MSSQKKIFFIGAFVVVFGALGLRQTSAQTVTAQPSQIVPTFTCLGSTQGSACPTLQIEPSPTVAQLLPDDEASPTEVVTTIAPTVAPLYPNPRQYQRRGNRHRANQGLIIRLIRIIEKLLGINPPQNGNPSPTPTPSGTITPTSNPTSAPTTAVTSVPTTAPTIAASPTGVEPTEVETTEGPEPTEGIEPTEAPEPGGSGNSLWEQILQLLQQLLELIRQFLGMPPSDDDGNPTPEPTLGVEPTETASPSAQPTLTAIPTALPTNTPVPTNTPIPTDTPQPTATTAPTLAVSPTGGPTSVEPTSATSGTPTPIESGPTPTPGNSDDNVIRNLLQLILQFLSQILQLLRSLFGQQ